MSVVILGGNECMERRYMDLCKAYSCDAKVFTKPGGGLKNKLGRPDLTIFFTSTMSHKMVQSALRELVTPYPRDGEEAKFSIGFQIALYLNSALRGILEKHTG